MTTFGVGAGIEASGPVTLETVGGGNYKTGPVKPGTTLKFSGAHLTTTSPTLYLFKGPRGSERFVEKIGPLNPGTTWVADGPGEYIVARVRNPSELRYSVRDPDNKTVFWTYTVEGEPTSTVDPDDYINVDNSPSPSDIATNNPGIVPADNDEGIALAPALRREGASLGPEGGTVTLPDGDTVDVGAIEESDEVARYLDGEQAGEVVDADQGAVGDPSSNGSGGGLIGAAVAAVVLLVAGGAALLGGDS